MHAFAYSKPRSIDELVSHLERAGDGARILAGGTDLLTQIRSGLVRPSLVLDLKGTEALHRLQATGEGLSIGAAVILNRILEQQELSGPYAALVQAVSDLASYPIRNRATLVGNVTNASPCADTVPPLCVMEACVELCSSRGSRQMPVARFITGNREVQLGPGELATRVVLPPLPPGAVSAFLKCKRVRGHDLALANAALLWAPQAGRLRLAVGSCSPAPTCLDLDAMADRPDAGAAAERAVSAIRPIDDVRAGMEYRKDMVAVMVQRLFSKLERARAGARA